jgi:beta-N-acetylhexosaminidase
MPLATLQKGGLLPFQAAITSGVKAVMTSNASVPGLTSLPASISPATISYLRNTMGFQGLVVTDSLGAGAISALHISVPQAAVEALGAGADLVLYGTPHSVAQSLAEAAQISSAIVKAVANGTLPLSTLQSAAAQVLAARQSLVSL